MNKKITSLDELMKAAVEERIIVDSSGNKKCLSRLNSTHYLQGLLDNGLYIKEPEPESFERLTIDEIDMEAVNRFPGDCLAQEIYRQGMVQARDIMEGRT